MIPMKLKDIPALLVSPHSLASGTTPRPLFDRPVRYRAQPARPKRGGNFPSAPAVQSVIVPVAARRSCSLKWPVRPWCRRALKATLAVAGPAPF
jgi:hypothetical protein